MDKKANATVLDLTDSLVTCQNSQGIEIQATLLRLTRHVAAFEVYVPSLILRMSEVLSEFKIVIHDRPVYSGRAVVSGLVNAGTVLVCEVSLDESWLDFTFAGGQEQLPHRLQAGFGEVLQHWQKTYKVLPEFKVVVADMQSLLLELRHWLEQVELQIRSEPAGDRAKMEREAAQQLAAPVLDAIDCLGDRFEEIASRLEPEARPVHIHYTKRQLHPILLCSPFGYRTHQKPLGYAGDYEMVNMIVRDPYEGSSLFAKIVNAWFLNQLPAQAHRNRLKILKEKLIGEAARAASQGRPARILNLGCGPAGEIQEFLIEQPISEQAQFTLLDFNEETVQHTSQVLNEIKSRHARHTSFQVQKKSVQHLLKEAAKPGANTQDKRYDFIYCAGLFDYLSDRVCKQLTAVFYEWLAPGGHLLTTNVDASRPFRNKLEFILDWNLIYRTGRELVALKPAAAALEDCSVKSDLTAVNVFLEIKRPEIV
jgi:extracellular factor (EF) 3-hydroxypalmitic acid methyl ester biosynthesis protein